MRIPFLKPKLSVASYRELWDEVSRDMREQLLLLRVLLDNTFERSFAIPEPSLLQADKSGVMRMEMQHPSLEYPAIAFEAELVAGDRLGYEGVSFVFRIDGYRGEQIGEYSLAKLKQQGFTSDPDILRGWIQQIPLLKVASLTMSYLEHSGIKKASALAT